LTISEAYVPSFILSNGFQRYNYAIYWKSYKCGYTYQVVILQTYVLFIMLYHVMNNTIFW